MIEGVMNYTGSKYKLLEQILPEFDYDKEYFIDLFAGGGSVYLNVVDRYQKIIVNDIIGDLIGIHSGLIKDDDIISETKLICPKKGDKDGFLELREDYNLNPTPAKLWALMLSSTNNMMRFNKKFKYNQTYGNRGWNPNTDKKVSFLTEHIRKYSDKIRFKSLSFKDFDIKSNNCMVYIDPPYSNTEAGYNSFWNKNDDNLLYEYILNLNSLGCSFMVSGSLTHNGKRCVLLDNLISYGFEYKELEYNYDKVSRNGKKEVNEIIIKNY